MIEAKKDTTRPSNVYYGLNWGYRSDETMEKSLDTGTLLYYNYDCDKCFSASDVVKCKMEQYFKDINPSDTQNIAFCQRTSKQELLVITSHFGSDPQVVQFHEFLNKPYIRMVKVRQLNTEPKDLVKNTYDFIDDIRKNKKKYGQVPVDDRDK